MSDLLPLCESSFRALEDAYEKQWRQARLLHQLPPNSDSSESVERVLHSAGVAATEMQRLCAETRRLHQRFHQIEANAAPPFSEDERARLSRLGFDVSQLVTAPVSCHDASAAVAQRIHTPTNAPFQVKDDAEVAELRWENAQLLTSLAWYRFRDEAAAAPRAVDGGVAPHTRDHDKSFSSASSAELLRLFNAMKARCALLCSSQRERAPPPPSRETQRAVDVAVEELLRLHNFPSQVCVRRIASTPLYMLDRPVCIAFASPHSSILVVQDPEGVEEDSDLRAYLMNLYKPLLRALNWRPPSTTDTTVTATGLAVSSENCRSPLPSLDTSQTICPALNIGTAVGDVNRGLFALCPSQEEFPRSVALALPQRLEAPATVKASDAALHEAPRRSSSALSLMTYEELVALKRAALQRLDRIRDTVAM
ncbi:hypothetical protein ABB37_00810 [Leptomonas pyrrhocoris]|uniref:Uncharacterized protein n=1 Tax=Leptomonas pyrrhocoris TaxID=157538 RepID=A0A0M9GB60_LEPPY|nr:hypothetical protein ABB37_00810 [Leptomonas pyrrhocoris]KPA86723.1 hypothetical protein ABB37_00810 [Leptomonas pyrrhocoris]|eukprot:XP_015665162.1 hypothetical protein ABB37_00810 [Leptomonas pyrrhocoris]